MEEIKKGLQPAIDEFLAAHRGEWALHKRYRNNNGACVRRWQAARVASRGRVSGPARSAAAPRCSPAHMQMHSLMLAAVGLTVLKRTKPRPAADAAVAAAV